MALAVGHRAITQKPALGRFSVRFAIILEPMRGFEPRTYALRMRCSIV